MTTYMYIVTYVYINILIQRESCIKVATYIASYAVTHLLIIIIITIY